MMRMNYGDEIKRLNVEIQKAQAQGKPADNYYKRQLELLGQQRDEFVSQAKEKGLENDLHTAELEIKLLNAMEYIAKKLNLPAQNYQKLIFDARARVLGEEAARGMFKSGE